MTDKIHLETWMAQPRIFAERVRGLPLIWTPEVNWFNNDWLGPTPHVHDDATEIGFMAQGQLEIQIGGSQRVYGPGDFMIMPPNKYHNYWFRGTDPVCFFVAVGPNHKYNRLRHDNFTPDNYEGDAPYANVFTSDTLPSNEHFASEKVTLLPGQSEGPRNIDLRERIVYIVQGTANVRYHTLAGTLAANQFLHIPATTPHEISNAGYVPLIFISLIVTDPDTAQGTIPQENN